MMPVDNGGRNRTMREDIITAPSTERPLAGIELGGTKCVCTLAHGPGAVIDRHVVPTTTPDETLSAISATLRAWTGDHDVAALGIASFGPLALDPAHDDYGRILATAKPHWPRADVRGALSASLDVPVGFDTDVNGAALAETRWGAGRGLDDFAYVTVGTGVGVGLVVGGRTVRGLGHSEVGHMRVPRMPGDDAPSACPYHDDCVEGLASGSALKLRLGGRPVETVGPDDPIWDPIVHTLAAMCHALVSTTAPMRIALGGGMMERQPTLIPRIQAALVASLNSYATVPDDYLVAPALGAMAGPLGSIALAVDALEPA
jgi:fructokinase